jgi:hypothetical protein
MVPPRSGAGHPFIFPWFLNHRRVGASDLQAGALFRP